MMRGFELLKAAGALDMPLQLPYFSTFCNMDSMRCE